ncbi:MAG TPA: iron-sulfur cluster carrier protein ApbC [Gammaproteobacteria bacterium]
MTAVSRADFERHLKTFIVPHTGRELGARGTSFTVAEREGGFRVALRCGFPLARSGPRLAEAIELHCRTLSPDLAVEVGIETEIKAHAVQRGLKPLPGVSNIVAVASGKGGVGKSTVAVNLALALAQEGARVAILDADIYGPSQPRMLGLLGRRPQSRDGKTIEPIEAHGIVAMSIGFLVPEEQPMAWRGPMVTSALNQLLSQTVWGERDYLIVDMPPGTGDIQLTLAQRVPVSGAIIVTTPQDIALADARKGLEMFQKVNVPVLGIVENMSLYVCPNCGHEEHIFGEEGGANLSRAYGVPLLGTLPLDRRIREETDSGEPTVVAEPDSLAAIAFREAALRAAGELAASAQDYSRLFPKITVEDT